MAAMALVTVRAPGVPVPQRHMQVGGNPGAACRLAGLMRTGRPGHWRPVCGELSEGYARGQVSREAWSAMFVMFGLVHQEHR